METLRRYALELPHRLLVRHSDKMIEAALVALFEHLVGGTLDTVAHATVLLVIGH